MATLSRQKKMVGLVIGSSKMLTAGLRAAAINNSTDNSTHKIVKIYVV